VLFVVAGPATPLANWGQPKVSDSRQPRMFDMTHQSLLVSTLEQPEVISQLPLKLYRYGNEDINPKIEWFLINQTIGRLAQW
jgi:hypothetical protein